jgi:diguanylate cyclase
MSTLGRRSPGIVAQRRPAAIELDVAAPDEHEIRRAIDQGEIVVHYQPVVNLGDGSIVAVEALARWEHPERGMLAPNLFIPAAERSGLIGPLGEAILEQSCEQVARWRRAGHDLALSVNLSAHQLRDGRLPTRLAAILDRTGMDPQQLWLEITETALVDDRDHTGAALWKIRELGPRLAIDDFGTGWGSLTYLCQFPIDALKIDRSFVGRLEERVNVAIVKSVITLGQELELHVVAEGIETVEQRDHLIEFGCTEGQGFLFARPSAPDGMFGDRQHCDARSHVV